MDLIGQLSSQLGLDPKQAQAVAGTVLGGVRDQVAEQAGPEKAKQMESAIPELGGWQQTATQLLGGGGGSAGGMLGAAAGVLGGGGAAGGLFGAAAEAVGGPEARQAAQLVAVLGQFGIDAKMAGVAAPIVLSFLKERLPDNVLDAALAAAPFLTGGKTDGGGGGGIGGALGGLFG